MVVSALAKREALEQQANYPLLKKPDTKEPARGAGRIVQLFTNVNMGKQHDGLALLCEQFDVDLAALEPGQYVVFTNTKRDKVKIYACNNVLAYLRLPPGHFVTLESCALIPLAFKGATEIEHEAGLSAIFGRRATREMDPGMLRGSLRGRGAEEDV